MSSINQPENIEKQNDYAENVKGEPLFIGDVESGLNGYYCIGCKNAMQAVKSKIVGRRSYFRHHIKDSKPSEHKCTFSNESYRHQKAKEILYNLRHIKVPAVYNYPPAGIFGKVYKIKDAEYIHAHKVLSEVTFYESDDGSVLHGSNIAVDEKNLLIKPDITFFDKTEKPILFIELVVKHKVDYQKLAKIKRLGINTVEVTVPKASLEDIAKIFEITSNTKWLYNYEQECTEYIFIPRRDSEDILSIDEEQRKLFEEVFECRKAEIRNLLNSITRCLESQPYRAIEGGIRSEISRVEENTKSARIRLEELRAGIRSQVESRNKNQYGELNERRERFEIEQSQFETDSRNSIEAIRRDFTRNKEEAQKAQDDLEGRYLRKRKELEVQLKATRVELGRTKDIDGERERIERKGSQLDQRFDELKREASENFALKLSLERVRIGKTREARKALQGKYKRLERESYQNFIGENELIDEEERSLPNRFKEEEGAIDFEFFEQERRIVSEIENGHVKELSEFATRVNRLLQSKRIFDDFQERQATFRRNYAALESIRKGDYKTWYKP